MTAPLWPELEALFHEALARPSAERAAWLAARCAGRPDLLAQLDAMLRVHDEAGSVTVLPAFGTPLTTGARLGAYEIRGPLGAGGMGEVYRARDTRLGRDVAIKVLSPGFVADTDRLARFEREARVLAALNHPNIAAIYGIEEGPADAGRHVRALVLELVEGDTLADRIARGPLPVADALAIARQIADALEAAHEKGIVHRDLKPSNIKVTPNGAVKVLDFGLAKAALVERSDAALGTAPLASAAGTREGMILGTAAYMSPEQARGQAVDKRTDIWAFGCVLFEMLCARPAFPGETVADTIAAILGGPPEWHRLPDTTPAGIRRLLQRCLEKDTNRRLHHIADARLEIDDALTARVEHHATVSASSPHRGRRRDRLTWAVVGMAVLVLAALAVPTVVSIRPAGAPEPVVTRFEIPTPPSVDPASFALSSDGGQLAFVATTAAGMRQLFIRPLNQVAAQPLPGTEGALFPFWAPDGRAVGFFAGGKLRRINLDGGAPQVLADASLWGATWNREGVIVFSPSGPGMGRPLLRVAASGGTPVAVTRTVPGVMRDAWPHFLPDGRRFLFFRLTNNADTTGVYLGSLDGGEPKQVTVAETAAVYAPPGALLLVRQGTLVALRFDPIQGVINGDPIPLAKAVGNGGYPLHRGAFAVSTTGVLAYRVGGGERRRQLVWIDRSGADRGTVGQPLPGVFVGAELSPDGRRVAACNVMPGNEVWLLDARNGVPSRFTFGQRGSNTMPLWSSDGRRVVFASTRNGVSDLFEKSADGTQDEQPLLVTPETKWPMAWSRDGRFLLYTTMPDPSTTNVDLWALPMVGERKPFPVVQTPFDESSGEVSPDGKWVAYTSNESGRFEVYAQSFPEPGGTRQISPAGGTQARWRPDGRELFYITPDGSLMAAPMAIGTDGQLEVGAPALLFQTRVNPYYFAYPQYSVAPDGRFLMNVVVEAPVVPPITVVLNWDAALKP